VTKASHIPTAHTPARGWHGEMPPPVLAGCDEALVAGAPDLRGLWEAYEIRVGGQLVQNHPALGHRQRIEQCGDRLVVTAGGIIHDMRCGGFEEHGVHDADVLRTRGLPLTVTRRLDGDVMVWEYGGAFGATLTRVIARA
jgi:hypothetical protein